MKIIYSSVFSRKLAKLERELQEEVFEKIDLFKDKRNHSRLKVHKLHGKLSEDFSFSVNYRIRIVFNYLSKDSVLFTTIGDHEIYK